MLGGLQQLRPLSPFQTSLAHADLSNLSTAATFKIAFPLVLPKYEGANVAISARQVPETYEAHHFDLCFYDFSHGLR